VHPMTDRYGKLFKLDDISDGAAIETLPRLSLKAAKGIVTYNELRLQTLIANQPNVLPVAEIEPLFDDAVPICTEMPVKSGFVDVILATPLGDLVVVECKGDYPVLDTTPDMSPAFCHENGTIFVCFMAAIFSLWIMGWRFWLGWRRQCFNCQSMGAIPFA